MRLKRKITITLQKVFLLSIAWVMVLLWGAAILDIMSYVISFKSIFPLSGVSKVIVYIDAVIVTGVLLAWRTGFIKICKI